MINRITFEKLALIMLAILLCSFNFFCTDIILQIASFWMFYLFTIFIMHFDFLHPYIWHLGVSIIYYTAYPILYSLNFRVVYGYTNEPLFIFSLCILTFIVFCPGYHNNSQDLFFSKKTILEKNNKHISRSLMHGMTILIIVAAVAIMALGYSSKVEIYRNNIFISTVLTLVLIYINIYTLEFCTSLKLTRKVDIPFLSEVLLSTFAISMISGERDIMFRMIVVTTLMLYYFKMIKKKDVIIIFIAFIIVIVPMSTQYKYFFLRGNINAVDYSNGLESFIVNFLTGDFESASRNLQILVNNKDITFGIMHGKTFLSDILSIFNLANNSAIRWFQDTFFTGRSTGMGFTIIGEGLLNFGYFGAIFEYAILALFVGWLYKNHKKSIYRLFYYFSAIPLFMYANRGDFANIISPFVKHILLSALLFYIIKVKLVVNEDG